RTRLRAGARSMLRILSVTPPLTPSAVVVIDRPVGRSCLLGFLAPQLPHRVRGGFFAQLRRPADAPKLARGSPPRLARRARAYRRRRGFQIAPISPALALSARQQHAVDHVNDAVRLEHVLNRDPGGIALGVADGQRLALEFDRELFAFDGLELGLPAALVGCLPQVLDREAA